MRKFKLGIYLRGRIRTLPSHPLWVTCLRKPGNNENFNIHISAVERAEWSNKTNSTCLSLDSQASPPPSPLYYREKEQREKNNNNVNN